MAEGDDKMEVPSSIYLKSEAVSEVFCEPCRETTKSNVAEWFCVDCSEYLCGHCYICHERYKRLENHVVHDKDHMPLDKKQVNLKDVCVTKCQKHNDKVIEYVCMSCDKIGCNVCMTIDHRSCEDVRYIPDEVTNPDIHREVQEFAKKLDNKDRELQNLQNKISNNLELTNDMYMKAMMDLDKQRDQIFAFFESLYDKQKLDIQEKQITDTSSIETSLNETVSMQTDLHKNKSQMNALEQSAQKCELYIFMKNTESTWEKMTSDMLKLLEKGKEITVRYESSAEVEEMLQGDIKYLGHLVNGEESQKSQKKLKLKKTSMKNEVKSVPQGKEDHEAAHLEIKTLNEGQKQEKIDLVTVPAEPEQREVKPNTPEVSEPVEVTPKPSVPEEPVLEVTAEPTKTPSSTYTDDSVSNVELKIEDGNDVELVKVDTEDDEEEEVMNKRLRYKYSEEQWSALNPEGKKHYDREFLLQFQNEYSAVQTQAGLPDIPDIILDKPQRMGRQLRRESSWGSGGEPDFIEFTPKYVWGGGGGGAGGQKSHGLPRQPSNQKNKGGPPPRHINVSVSKDIELDNTKDAGKPSRTDLKRETEEYDAKTRQIMELTFCSREKAEIALYDCKNDMDKAVSQILEEGSYESEWRESGKKKKKQKPEPALAPTENHTDTKPDRRDNRDRNDREKGDRNKEEKENGDRNFRELSDHYRQRAHRNDNRPPRFSRGRGQPDRAGDRPERGDEENEKDDNRDRGFDRGRGLGLTWGRLFEKVID